MEAAFQSRVSPLTFTMTLHRSELDILSDSHLFAMPTLRCGITTSLM